MIYLRQSTASQEVPLGYFLDSTNGNDEETGLTIANTDIKIWKSGATTLANKNSGGGTHISNGVYYATLDATDTDTIGPLVVFIHVSGALAVRLECVVLDEAVYDAMFGTTALATATNITAGTITTVTNLTNLPAITSNWLTAAGIASGALNGKGDWNIGKTGYALSSAGIQAIWDALTSALTTVGSVGKLIVDYLDAAISSRLASASYTAPLDAAGTRTAIGLASANLDTQLNNQLALLGYIDANATTILGDVANLSGRIPTALVGGRMDANVGAISGDVTAADNAEAFFDGTGYAGTNNVIPTVTTLTNAPSDSSGVTTLLSRLTATRAGYLDNLSAGAAALEASVQSVLSKLLKYVQLMVRKDAAIATDNATELTAINANGGSGAGAYDNTTDATEAIRDRGDAAWTTGAGGANPAVLQNTTIATLASQTSFTLTAGSADDNAYNGHLIVVTDQTTAEQKAVGVVSDYVGSTKTVTLAESPGIFTMAVGDEVDILVGKANMVAIDGALTNGNNATLNLKQLNIVNSAGTALVASSTGSSGHGISATGNGVGEGISAVGGSADGYGISAAGQGLGAGFIATSPAGAGIYANGGTNAPGISTQGAGSGAGILSTGGPTGHGISAVGGISSGNGLNAAATAGNGHGANIAGQGSGHGINVTGGATGNGIDANGGATSGDGINAAAPTEGDGMSLTGAGAGVDLDADVAWNPAWDSEVQSEVDDALVAHNLDHLVGTATGIPAIPAGTFLDQIMDDGTAAYDRTTDSLQAIRDRGDAAWTGGGGLSAQDVRDAMKLAPTAGAAAGGSIDDMIATNETNINDIQDRIPVALVSGRIDASVGAMQSGVVTAAAIATGAIDADALATDAVAEVADGVWDEARSGHTTAGTYGESFLGVVNGQAATGTLSTTQMTTNLTEATDDHYNGRIVVFITGALAGQATDITDYTGATKLITMTALTEAPANGDRFVIV